MRRLEIRHTDLSTLDQAGRALLTKRSARPDPELSKAAAEIVAEVRGGGNEALQSANRRFGGGSPSGRLLIPRSETAAALSRVADDLRAALEAVIDAIETVHRPQVPEPQTVTPAPGVRIDRRWSPLRRIAVYVPGGGAKYPSSLLMGAVPARVAGVREIVIATPAGPEGSIPDVVLAAAALVDASEVYAMGGAQAIGALAYGTESIEPVQKIVGPGNAWVTAAKLVVFGDVAIDLPAGPSEALVLIDESANPRVVAADVICQAEHGPDSPVVLVATRPEAAASVLEEIRRLLPGLNREETIAKALTDHGLVAIAADINDGVAFANAFAPEHVTVHTADAAAVSDRLDAAGSIFIGHWSPESAGDYATGANHILPTGGRAAAHSPLGVEDFGSWRQVQHLSRTGLEGLRPTISALADAEGLSAHRLAAEIRFEEEPSR